MWFGLSGLMCLIAGGTWGMSWSELPLLVRWRSQLIYIQLPCDLVSIWAVWQLTTTQPVGWQLVQRSSSRHTRRGQGVWRTWRLHFLHMESIVLWCAVWDAWRTPSLSDTHIVAHCPRYQPSVQYTHKLCSHPPLPLIQCSNSTPFCNTVTQSHQLFIKDFCTSSVVGLIDWEMEWIKRLEIDVIFQKPQQNTIFSPWRLLMLKITDILKYQLLSTLNLSVWVDR